MLKDLRIKNYRGFEDFYIDGLARVNLIVGDNNIGKTSFLEAIYLLVKQPLSPNEKSVLLEILERRGELIKEIVVKTSSEKVITDYIYENLHFGYQITEQNQEIKISSKIDIKNLIVFSIKYQTEFEKINISFMEEAKAEKMPNVIYRINYQLVKKENNKREYKNNLKEIKGQLNTFNASLFSPISIIFIDDEKIDTQNIRNLWDQINLTPKEDIVLDSLKIIIPNLQKIALTVSHTPPQVRLRIKDSDSPIPLSSMGSGMKKIFQLAMSCLTVENGILLVDEIETGLHYEAQTDMWRLLIETAKELNIQIFATTHSWDCICALQEALEGIEDKSVAKLFRLDKNMVNFVLLNIPQKI